MSYVVTLDGAVDFGPKNKVLEILQNVRTILSTCQGSVPLDRDFGLSWEHIDKPLSVAKMLTQVEIIDAVEEYEPRVKVLSVEYEETADEAMTGQLRPRVTIEIIEEEE